ncbi:hypothetical protein [Maritalea sp.]|uniref:hypothetical protein n=1 Tax=Maritalea sp. TaxID=2003361 RepID=UPI003EF485EA
MGFTLKHGNFGKVIRTVEQRHPGLLEFTIGASKSSELLDIIDAKAVDKKKWGNSLSKLPQKYMIHTDWEDAFDELGNQSEVRVIQDEVAHNVYWARAQKDLEKYGRQTESDAALFFDTAVQNGGIDKKKAKLMADAFSANPNAKNNEKLRLHVIAEAIASGSNSKFYEDVLSRKGCIAAGKGRVHGARYFLKDWALGQ